MKDSIVKVRFKTNLQHHRTKISASGVNPSSTCSLPRTMASILTISSLLVLSVEAFTRIPHVSLGIESSARYGLLSGAWRQVPCPDRHGDACISSTALNAATRSEKDDTAEWKAILATLTLYKAAYGDVKVPQRFVVPSAAPWPKPAWGIKLGKVVGSIRTTGKFVQSRPRRRQVLDDLGFLWQARSAPSSKEKVTFGQLVEAIEAYREFLGNGAIPSNFVIPDVDPWPTRVRGLPLGAQLNKLPEKLPPKASKKLKELGVLGEETSSSAAVSTETASVSANDQRFQKVYLALQTYKQIYGDLLVPQPFSVPQESPWAEDIWGLRLGARVNAIRSQGTFINSNPNRRKMLDELGFSWSPPKERTRKEAATNDSDGSAASMDALFGSFDFGQDFIGKREGSPETEPAPTWGLEGGRTLGDDLAAQKTPSPSDEDYAPPRTFEESMEEATKRALECGVIEGMTENKRVIKGRREKNVPWFNDDFGGAFVFDDVVEALTIYKSIYNDFDNLTQSEEFFVPTPEVKSGFYDDIGGDIDSFDADASSRAAAALAQFENEESIGADALDFQNDIKTETRKLSGAGADQWPEHLAGMALGNIVARIRDGSLEVKHIKERKAKLDTLDFDWGDPVRFLDVPFEKAICAMYAYFLVRGDMFVREEFVMPDEDPWPQALAGYELGKTVHKIRELQNFFEAYHPEKVSLLRMLDFVWFPTMARPLDPNEPEMTTESLLLGGLGHPDYSKMIDIPMGLPDKIINEGPYFDSDDPKFWWRKWHNWDNVKDYWYQLGRRDNAYVLRKMGYPQMAEEHEAKYGPGLFTRMNATMEEIEAGLDGKSLDEKKEIIQTLNFYRQEMLGCTDLPAPDKYQWLADLDTEMLKIMEDSDIQLEEDEDEYEDEDELAADDGKDESDDAVSEDLEFEYEDDPGEEFDIEDELGLTEKQ